MSKYTAEEVEFRAAAVRCGENDITANMLRDYAALLRERESAKAVVTDEIFEAFDAAQTKAMGEYEMQQYRAGKESHLVNALDFATRAALEAVAPMLASTPHPIPMILHCPSCHAQHIDRIETDVGQPNEPWMNPPHRSHLCHNCGTIWRPADMATTGVERIQTQGKHDMLWPAPMLASARVLELENALRMVVAANAMLSEIEGGKTLYEGSPTHSTPCLLAWSNLNTAIANAKQALAAAPKPEGK